MYATNLMQALPNEAETIEAIQALDLLVVVDVIPSEIAGWADVVLPESTYLERYDDLNVECIPRAVRGAAAARRAAADRHDQKPNWWIARKLAMKLGLGAYYPWKTIEEYLDTRLTKAGPQPRRAEAPRASSAAHRSRSSSKRAWRPSSRHRPARSSSTRPSSSDAGFDPVPRYTPPAPPPPGSFRLLVRPRAGALLRPHADQPDPRTR